MRNYILTDRERKLLKYYIDDRMDKDEPANSNQLYILFHRIRKNISRITEDYLLIRRALSAPKQFDRKFEIVGLRGTDVTEEYKAKFLGKELKDN